jgi:hypothetical protein
MYKKDSLSIEAVTDAVFNRYYDVSHGGSVYRHQLEPSADRKGPPLGGPF